MADDAHLLRPLYSAAVRQIDVQGLSPPPTIQTLLASQPSASNVMS